MSNDWTVLRLPLPTDGAERADVLAALAGATEVDRATLLESLGHDDFVRSPVAWLHRLQHRVAFISPVFVALAGTRDGIVGVRPEDVLGYAAAGLPTADNLHLADEVEVRVRPDVRRRGIGSALLDALIAVARAEGRTHLLGFSAAPVADPDDPGALRSRSDPLAAVRTGAAEFALARGFAVAQIERYSVQQVPDAPPPPAPTPGYRLESWVGSTPTEHLAGFAALWVRFSQEVPLGDLVLGREAWDADRLAAIEAVALALGERCTTLAIHEASGEIVGASQLFRVHDKDASAEQGVTLTLPGHRGHGLGLAIKRANLATAKQGWPALARVHTWNAGENDHMWRINELVGYRTQGAEIAWQWIDPRVDDAG